MEQSDRQHLEAQIHGGHLALIALCAVLLVGVTFMKNGFTLHVKAGEEKKVKVTKAEIERQVAMEMNQNYQTGGDNQDEIAKLAIVDPNFSEGLVAGTSTASQIEGLPSASDIPDEVLNAIKVLILDGPTNATTVMEYANQVVLVESTHNAMGLLIAVSGEDVEAAKAARPELDALILDLAKVPVPSQIQNYHKLKLMYYESLIQWANNSAQEPGAVNIETLSSGLLALTDKLSLTEREIEEAYGVTLW